MRTCYFYTRIWDEAVAALPPDAEKVYVGRTFTSYWQAIADRWGSDDLLIVEHDIVIHDQVVDQLEECPNVWCVFPYWHDTWLDENLGCTRFRVSAQKQVTPDEVQQGSWGSCWECNPHGGRLPSAEELADPSSWMDRVKANEIPGCWRHLDGKLSCAMRKLGYEPCIHLPPVEHLTHRVLPEGEFYVRSWE